MKKTLISLSILASISAFGLAACGGGGGGSSGATSKTTTGVITGFGSVFVNGVEYETAGATVSSDGVTGSESDLAVGDVVMIQGSVNSDGTTGTATVITYRDELEGVVLSNSIVAPNTTGTMNIMGQSVEVVATTIFKSDVAAVATIDQVNNTHVVEVSGYGDGNGHIVATRIEVKKAYVAGDTTEVKGVVSALDSSAKSFVLGGLTVNYSGAESVPSNLANDLYVEVTSTSAPVGSVLTASKVEVEDDGIYGVQGGEGEEIEIQGVLTAVDSVNNTVVVNGQTISVSAETAAAFSSSLGSIVKVEATVQNGDLVGDVEAEEEGNVEVQAQVDSVDANAKTVTILGQPVQVTNSTMMLDESNTQVRYFDLTDISAGDYLEVHAYRDTNGALVATEVTREETPSTVTVLLVGKVEAVSDTSATVSGFTVDTTLVSGVTLGIEANVEVTGTWNGSVLSAAQISVE